MDIKLKNRHKLAVILIILIIMVPSCFMVSQYRDWYRDVEMIEENINYSAVTSEWFLENFVEAGYILYNTESGRENVPKDIKELLREYFSEQMDSFEDIYPYLDYRVVDGDGKEIAKSASSSGDLLTEKKLSNYELGIVVEFDENGSPDVRIKRGEYKEDQIIELRRIMNEYDGSRWEQEIYDDEEGTWENYRLDSPKDRTYIFAMTKENLKTYLDNERYLGNYYAPDNMIYAILLLMLLIAAAAVLYPAFRSLHTGNEKIFQAPFELMAVVFIVAMAGIWDNLGWMLRRTDGRGDFVDVIIWCVFFSVIYWSVSCLRQVYVLGVRKYIEERTFFIPFGRCVKRVWNVISRNVKKYGKKIYRSITSIDLTEKSNKAILKIVLCNYLILVAICFMWYWGVMALIIYSVILFFILRKYYNDIKVKYGILLKATNEIAEGNLDVTIDEELGVFSPFKTEIQKIQAGFKKAVDEEVKSQRMKTDLITNVSHDLKTPLTAIITYVNLLKEEKDEEKQKDYIEVLERKSMRLKALIEDLFEISKASSKNVILHMIDVDVVNLFKQVRLELDDKIQNAGLDFRCTYPEGKVIASLDSQKTYRVFENLIINIVKYAMPHTRVYVEIRKEGSEAVIRMKNVSAEELNFNPEEITERFVRGDASRNTEGSGLGLAIAKSFVELQKGKFKIETEADLFKVEIRWEMKQNQR